MTDIEIGALPQPREVMVKRFVCPSCGWRRATKKDVVEHMARCWYDPAHKTCKTCINFSISHAEPEVGAPEVIWCGAQSKELQYAETPVVDCALWRDRDDEEGGPAEDEWDAGLRGLSADGGEFR